MRSATRKKIGKDLPYLRWIKTLPCSVPDCNAIFIDAHHAGQRGLMQKADDHTAIPLCMAHHQTGPEAAHVLGKRFWDHHGIDRDALIAALNVKYEMETEGYGSSVLSALDVVGCL